MMKTPPPESARVPTQAPANPSPRWGKQVRRASDDDVRQFRQALGGAKPSRRKPTTATGGRQGQANPSAADDNPPLLNPALSRAGDGLQQQQGQGSDDDFTGGLAPVDADEAAAYVQAMAQQPPGSSVAGATALQEQHAIQQAAAELVANLTRRSFVSQHQGETRMRVELAESLLPGVSVELTRDVGGGVSMTFNAANAASAEKLATLQASMQQSIAEEIGAPIAITITDGEEQA